MEEPKYQGFVFEDPVNAKRAHNDFRLVLDNENEDLIIKRKQVLDVKRAWTVRDPVALENRRAAWSLFVYSILLITVITFTLYDSASIVHDCFKYMKDLFWLTPFDISVEKNFTKPYAFKGERRHENMDRHTTRRIDVNKYIDTTNLENLKFEAEFWDYFAFHVPQLIFGEIMNEHSFRGPCNKIISQNTTGGRNTISKLVGLPRIRQLRVRRATCDIPDLMEGMFSTCYGLYNEKNEDRRDIKPKSKNISWTRSAWSYSEASTFEETISGTFGTYPPGGFMTLLASSENRTQWTVRNLKENGWIDQGTRAVIAEFTLYNVHMNFFIFTKILVEFPTTGILKSTASFYACQIFTFLEKEDFVIAAFRIIFVAFIVVHCGELFLLFFRFRFQIFRSYRVYLHVAFILASIIHLVMYVIHLVIIEPMALDLMLASKGAYVNFDLIKVFHYYYTASSILMALLFWVELFRRLIEKNNTILASFPMIYEVMKEKKSAILACLVLYMILNLSFSLMSHLRFGSNVLEFHSFKSSFIAMMMTLAGAHHYEAVQDLNIFQGTLLPSTFHFIVYFIYEPLFLAIMTAGYRSIQDRRKFRKNHEKSLGMTREVDKMPPNIRLLNTIRESCVRASFTNTEINRFFSEVYARSLEIISERSANRVIRVLEKRRNDHYGQKYAVTSEKELLQNLSMYSRLEFPHDDYTD